MKGTSNSCLLKGVSLPNPFMFLKNIFHTITSCLVTKLDTNIPVRPLEIYAPLQLSIFFELQHSLWNW
jgi:hypothetical protein